MNKDLLVWSLLAFCLWLFRSECAHSLSIVNYSLDQIWGMKVSPEYVTDSDPLAYLAFYTISMKNRAAPEGLSQTVSYYPPDDTKLEKKQLLQLFWVYEKGADNKYSPSVLPLCFDVISPGFAIQPAPLAVNCRPAHNASWQIHCRVALPTTSTRQWLEVRGGVFNDTCTNALIETSAEQLYSGRVAIAGYSPEPTPNAKRTNNLQTSLLLTPRASPLAKQNNETESTTAGTSDNTQRASNKFTSSASGSEDDDSNPRPGGGKTILSDYDVVLVLPGAPDFKLQEPLKDENIHLQFADSQQQVRIYVCQNDVRRVLELSLSDWQLIVREGIHRSAAALYDLCVRLSKASELIENIDAVLRQSDQGQENQSMIQLLMERFEALPPDELSLSTIIISHYEQQLRELTDWYPDTVDQQQFKSQEAYTNALKELLLLVLRFNRLSDQFWNITEQRLLLDAGLSGVHRIDDARNSLEQQISSLRRQYFSRALKQFFQRYPVSEQPQTDDASQSAMGQSESFTVPGIIQAMDNGSTKNSGSSSNGSGEKQSKSGRGADRGSQDKGAAANDAYDAYDDDFPNPESNQVSWLDEATRQSQVDQLVNYSKIGDNEGVWDIVIRWGSDLLYGLHSDTGESTLYVAVENHHLDTVKLIEVLADKESEALWKLPNRDGQTPGLIRDNMKALASENSVEYLTDHELSKPAGCSNPEQTVTDYNIFGENFPISHKAVEQHWMPENICHPDSEDETENSHPVSEATSSPCVEGEEIERLSEEYDSDAFEAYEHITEPFYALNILRKPDKLPEAFVPNVIEGLDEIFGAFNPDTIAGFDEIFQASEHYHQCAIHPAFTHAFIRLECCFSQGRKVYICDYALMIMAKKNISEFVMESKDSASCPVCKSPVMLFDIIQQAKQMAMELQISPCESKVAGAIEQQVHYGTKIQNLDEIEQILQRHIFLTKVFCQFTTNVEQQTCVICLTETKCLKLNDQPCDHLYCQECLKQYIEIAATDINLLQKGYLTCPGVGCSTIIPEQVCEYLTCSELMRKLNDNLLKLMAQKNKNLSLCLNPKCDNVLDISGGVCGGKMVCNRCERASCIECRVFPFHEGWSCQMYKTALTSHGAEAMFKTFKQTHSHRYRPCPVCNTDIYKDLGCNHMHCSHCNNKFCWSCMKVISGYDHFNEGRCQVREQQNERHRDVMVLQREDKDIPENACYRCGSTEELEQWLCKHYFCQECNSHNIQEMCKDDFDGRCLYCHTGNCP